MVTICTYKRARYFGQIKNGEMVFNSYGEIIDSAWHWLSDYCPYITLDEYVVMPNHFHGILYIDREHERWAARKPPLQDTVRFKPLSEIIAAFKNRCTKLIHLAGLPEFQWQRSFFDNIIRDDTSLENFRRYIRENPIRWYRDRNNQ